MSLPQRITFQIPSDTAFLSVARMFGSSIARTFGFDQEVTDDLRLALSEICAAAAEAEGDHGGVIDMGVTWESDTVRVACSPVQLAANDPRWMLISALMQQVRLDPHSGELSFVLAR